MKKTIDWLNKSRAKKITCSQVVELIANQEYQIGHPHVHISDGFELTFPKDTLTLPQIASKEYVWGPTIHLHPADSNPIPAVGRTNKTLRSGLFIDKNMLPESDKYLKRGRGKIPGVPYQAPVAETVYVTDRTGKAVIDKNTGLQKTYQKIVQKAVKECPEIPAKIPHSMFEDGESAVMTLTAVLNSIAGARALFQLMGNDKAVVFSHTAVDALHKFTNHMKGSSAHTLRKKKIMMKEWRDLQGNGKFEAKSLDIDHVVTVLKKDGNKLILTTHFPCAEPMNRTPTQGVTTGRLDLLETDRDIFYGLRVDFPLPAINW